MSIQCVCITAQKAPGYLEGQLNLGRWYDAEGNELQHNMMFLNINLSTGNCLRLQVAASANGTVIYEIDQDQAQILQAEALRICPCPIVISLEYEIQMNETTNAFWRASDGKLWPCIALPLDPTWCPPEPGETYVKMLTVVQCEAGPGCTCSDCSK